MKTAREFWNENNDGEIAELVEMTPGKLGFQDPDLWLELRADGGLMICDAGGNSQIADDADIEAEIADWKEVVA